MNATLLVTLRKHVNRNHLLAENQSENGLMNETKKESLKKCDNKYEDLIY